MKKIGIGVLLITLIFVMTNGCADEKRFVIDNGGNQSVIVAEPYGWMNQHKKVENVTYQICVGNIVWDILLSETIIVPVVLTGLALWEPVEYVPPTIKEIIVNN